MKLEEIARLAGVSRTTASYVVNGKAEQHRISEKTRERVMAVVNEYNYKPDQAATALRLGSSRLFGFILPDLENASYARLAKLLEAGAREHGFQLIITCSDDNPETEKALAEMLTSRRIDALLVSTVLDPYNDFYPRLQQKGLPVIAIDRALDDEKFASVISENLDGAIKLTHSLLSPLPVSIGLLGAVSDLGISHERECGFHAALREAKAKIEPQIAYGEHFSRSEGARICTDWIARGVMPEALVTTSYVLLEGVLDVLREYPDLMQKTRLATFGDSQLLDFLPIKVNALPQQYPLISERALALALAATEHNYKPGIEVVPRRLKVRSNIS
jgi:LacI family transcriptional regulator, fructose operon transcriptional repressor